LLWASQRLPGNNLFGRQECALFPPFDVWALIPTDSYQTKWFDTQASHPKKDLKSRHLGQANSMPFDTLQSSASLTLRKVEKFVLLRLTLSCLWASEAILVEIVAQNRLSAQTQGFYTES
jgi:hypothetical protein